MSNKTTKLFIAILIIVLIGLNMTTAFAAAPDQQGDQTIVDIAVADGRFTTLVAALQQADLVDTLSGEGPFTVFAPTDDAFAALPAGALTALLADNEALTAVLLYHVVPGKVMAADVVNLSSADTVLGQPISITVDGSTVMVNEAQVIITDIEGSNGVIHVIDDVLLPPADVAPAPAPLPQAGGEVPASSINILALFILGLMLIAGGLVVRNRLAQGR